MTSRDFAFWLQGFFELQGAQVLSERQTTAVKQHLALVFKHDIDPSMGDADHQADLNEVHDKIEPHLLPRVDTPGGSLIRC